MRSIMMRDHPPACECDPCVAERRTIEARLHADTQTSEELRSTINAYTMDGGTVTAAQYVAAIWALKARGET